VLHFLSVCGEKLDLKLVQYPKLDQKVCLILWRKTNSVHSKREIKFEKFTPMVVMETNHSLLRYCFTVLTTTLSALLQNKIQVDCQITEYIV